MNGYKEITDYLRALSQKLIEGCRQTAYDGTTLYTPDGIAGYNALWLRDFSYMVEYAGFAIPEKDIIDCIKYSIKHKREDGWMPDRVTGDGRGVYAAGEMGAPIGEANLDNTPFLVFTVYSLFKRMDTDKFTVLFADWEAELRKGLALIPLSPSGLVYNNPARPHSPYGFTDTVCKTGELFMESLLLWRALRMMGSLSAATGIGVSVSYTEAGAQIERSIHSLRDSGTGLFFAADTDCRQLDIWGNAYMLAIGFPCGDECRRNILEFLASHYEEYMYRGQVRHLLKGEYWQRLLINVPFETYQNGAYWATATGWIIWCLSKVKPSLAEKTLKEVTDYFKEEGAFECVNDNYRKLDSFVVSAANVYGGAVRAFEERNKE